MTQLSEDDKNEIIADIIELLLDKLDYCCGAVRYHPYAYKLATKILRETLTVHLPDMEWRTTIWWQLKIEAAGGNIGYAY